MADRISTRATGPGNISKLTVISNTDKGRQFDITGLGPPVQFKYYESLLQDVIYASVTYVDPGTYITGKGGGGSGKTIVNGSFRNVGGTITSH